MVEPKKTRRARPKKAEAESTLRVPGRLDMRLVWLRLNARRGTITAHVFHDYVKVESRATPFLSVYSACGKRRDERLRVPPSTLYGKTCKRCLGLAASEIRCAGDRAEILKKYGIKKGSRR